MSNPLRPVPRELSKEERDLVCSIQDKADEMKQLFDLVKAGRYRSLAMTSLEEAVMWIVKEATR